MCCRGVLRLVAGFLVRSLVTVPCLVYCTPFGVALAGFLFLSARSCIGLSTGVSSFSALIAEL